MANKVVNVKDSRTGFPQVLVVVDPKLERYGELIAGLHASVETLVLAADGNGIHEITSRLSQFRSIRELHVFAHGTAGRISLGEATLSLETLPLYADEMRRWPEHLADDAAIQLYSCGVASTRSGELLAEAIASLTGASVSAARTDLGLTDQGVNWSLDFNVGGGRAANPLAEDLRLAYRGQLALADGEEIKQLSDALNPVALSAAHFLSAYELAGLGSDLQEIKLLELPQSGSLQLDGLEVTEGQEIQASDLSSLVYVPDSGTSNSVFFSWQGGGGGTYADATITTTVSGLQATDSVVQVSVDSSEVTGVLGDQSWGDIKVTATGLDGKAQLVSLGDNGLGVGGGRGDDQIDFEVEVEQIKSSSSGGDEPHGLWAQTGIGVENWEGAFKLAEDPLINGIFLRIPWFQLEVAKGVYDFSAIDDAVARAEKLGLDVGIMVKPHTFGKAAENPYTAGPPKYIIDDHQTYGGSPGAGGLEPARSKADQWRSRRWDEDFKERETEMLKAVVERYDDVSSVKLLGLPESSPGISVKDTPDYSADKYSAAIIAQVEEVSAVADNITVTQWLNYISGSKTEHLQLVYDAISKIDGVAVGGPDLRGTENALRTYGIFNEGDAPVDMSVQWSTYGHVGSGQYSWQDVLDVGLDYLNSRIIAVQARNSGSSTTDDLLDAIRSDKSALAWATEGPQSVPSSGETVEVVSESSEELTLEFPQDVNEATLRIAGLLADGKNGALQEVGRWQAADATGKVIASGLLVPQLGTEIGEGIYDFTINVGQPFESLTISATHYNDDPNSQETGDNSDFSVQSVSYDVETTAPVVTSEVIGGGSEENTAPVANEDSGFVAVNDVPVIISGDDLVKNDLDPDGDLLVIMSVQNAVNGTVLLSGEQIASAGVNAFVAEDSGVGSLTPLSQANVTFIPDAGYVGDAQFDYTVSDGKGGTATATVHLEVAAAGELVVTGGEDDTLYFTTADFESAFEDSDLANSLERIRVVDLPENGTLFLNGATVMVGNEIAATDLVGLTFSPDANWHGVTEFQWSGYGADGVWSATSTAKLIVESVNDLPVAVDDTGYVTSQNVPISIALDELLGNDTDADLDPLTIDSVGDASNGSVVIDGDQAIFTPDAGYSGSGSFQYTVNDGIGGSAVATVAIGVGSEPAAPIELVAERGSLSGSKGNQYWGDVKVSAESADGSEALVRLSNSKGGIGVAGGRFPFQIDFITPNKAGEEGSSEQLALEFPTLVNEATVTIGALHASELKGKTEMGAWHAYSSTGELVGSGVFDPRDGNEVGANAYEFDILASGVFEKLVFSASSYDNASDNWFRNENSDFMLKKVTYTPLLSEAAETQVADTGPESADFVSALDVTKSLLDEVDTGEAALAV